MVKEASYALKRVIDGLPEMQWRELQDLASHLADASRGYVLDCTGSNVVGLDAEYFAQLLLGWATDIEDALARQKAEERET